MARDSGKEVVEKRIDVLYIKPKNILGKNWILVILDWSWVWLKVACILWERRMSDLM